MAKEILYSVSQITFFENELRTVFVIGSEKESELDILSRGLKAIQDTVISDLPEDIREQRLAQLESGEDEGHFAGFEECTTLADAKEQAFNMDSMVDVKRFRKSEAV